MPGQWLTSGDKMKKLLLFLFIASSIYAESPFRVEFEITSDYESTIGYGGARRNGVHQGIDIIPVSYDWIIFPILPGTVKEIGIDPVYGKYAIVEHEDGLFSLYAHGSTIYYSAAGQVGTDTPIMRMGSTGYSDGPHLHLEVYRIIDGEKVNEDPKKYIMESFLVEE